MNSIAFRMEIKLNDEYYRKLVKLHEAKGGSNVAISEVIEEALKRGIDGMLEKKK